MMIKNRFIFRISLMIMLSVLAACLILTGLLLSLGKGGMPVSALQDSSPSPINAEDPVQEEKNTAETPDVDTDATPGNSIDTTTTKTDINEDPDAPETDWDTDGVNNGSTDDNTPEITITDGDETPEITDGSGEETNAPDADKTEENTESTDDTDKKTDDTPKNDAPANNDKGKDSPATAPKTDDNDGADVSGIADALIRFVEIVKGELGTEEKPYNNVKYNTWYYGKEVSGSYTSQYSWCITFISWCANKAGIGTNILPKTASSESLRNFYIERGLYEKRSAHTPKVGDIVFFGSSKATHAGVVVSVDGNKIEVIEGNCSDKVKLMTYKFTESSIMGYASPNFSAA